MCFCINRAVIVIPCIHTELNFVPPLATVSTLSRNQQEQLNYSVTPPALKPAQKGELVSLSGTNIRLEWNTGRWLYPFLQLLTADCVWNPSISTLNLRNSGIVGTGLLYEVRPLCPWSDAVHNAAALDGKEAKHPLSMGCKPSFYNLLLTFTRHQNTPGKLCFVDVVRVWTVVV